MVENFSKYVRLQAPLCPFAGRLAAWPRGCLGLSDPDRCSMWQCAARSTHDTVAIPAARATRARRAQQTNPRGMQAPYYMQQEAEEGFAPGLADDLPPPGRRGGPMAEQLVPPGAMGAMARRQRERGPEHGVEEEDDDGLGAERYCLCDRVSFGEMIGCDADDCALGGGWFHISCVGLTAASMPADGQQWFCPMCRTPGLPHLHKCSPPQPAAPTRDPFTDSIRPPAVAPASELRRRGPSQHRRHDCARAGRHGAPAGHVPRHLPVH